MMTRKKLLFYCQHVLGMGHFIRSAAIVRGLRDFEVYFLNGGEIVPGFALPATVEVINLPPIKADAEFRDIHAVGGAQTLDEIKAARKQRILAEYDRIKPDVLVIELFPFGRLKFAFELLPLLERALAGETKIVCSLRDILVSKREQQTFEEEACRLINQYFDLLLVHADPRLQRLEETFPRAADLKAPLVYTGFVAPQHDEASASEIDQWLTEGAAPKILVSIGGGRVGRELIDCAIAASGLLTTPHRMLIFTGPYLSEADFHQLQNQLIAQSRIKLARYTTNFLAHLQQADLSISMAGYNTCMDIIAARARAIVYPFTGNNNQEQTIRAHKLRALGLVEVIHGDELQPENLLTKIQTLLQQPRPPAAALDLNGTEKTAAALTKLAGNNNKQMTEEL
jgi:predicted glycosyltransferase